MSKVKSVLAKDGFNYHAVLLKGGETYSICIDADDPDVDFDVFVYDEKGFLVEQDTDDDSDALCFVTPLSSGTYKIKVEATGTGKGGTYDIRITMV